MKVDFTNMATVGEEPAHPRVRFSSLPVAEPKPVNGLVKTRYVPHGHAMEESLPENAMNSFPGTDFKLKVDPQHYEQWARVPNKRYTNTLLFRGIQQLKARVNRDSLEDEIPILYSRQTQTRDLVTRSVNTADAATRDNNRDTLPRLVSSKDVNLVQRGQSCTKERNSNDAQTDSVTLQDISLKEIPTRHATAKDKEKTEAKVARVSLKFKYIEHPDGQTSAIRRPGMFSNTSVESGFSRSLSSIRHPSKQNENPAESNANEQENRAKLEHDYQTKQESHTYKEYSKHKHGTGKLRERSPFPVSIKQPKYYGEPAYHLSEPYKHREMPKSRTRVDLPNEYITKPDYVKPETSTVATKFEVMEFKLPEDASLLQEEFYRSKSFMASFPSKKQQASRTPAVVPSADFCDISQLEDVRQRHSAYANLLERTRTESAVSCKNPNLLKWVPRVQRMKELLK